MKKYKKQFVYTHDDLNIVVNELIKCMELCQIFAFTGSLGAGKTTAIKAFLRHCGVTAVVTSPTFTYVNEYANNGGERFFHFDLYRIANVDEFQEQGFDEYLYQSNSWAFIEWPEVIRPLLTHNVCWVSFDYHQDCDKRVVTIECG